MSLNIKCILNTNRKKSNILKKNRKNYCTFVLLQTEKRHVVMTDFQIYVHTVVLLIPIFAAGACMMLVAFLHRYSLTLQERKLKEVVLLYLLMTLISWVSIFCYLFFPKVFVVVQILCLVGFVMAPVFFYRFIRLLTRLEQEEAFSWLHYVAPALIGLVFLVWSLFVPFDVQLTIVESRKLFIAGEYELFSRLFTSKPFLRMIFLIVYYAFIAQMLVRYYHKASRSDPMKRKPGQWVIFLIIMSLAFLLSSAKMTFTQRSDESAYAFSTTVAALCISVQFFLLTYPVIRRQYLLYTVQDVAASANEPAPSESMAVEIPNEAAEPSDAQKKTRTQHTGRLTRTRLNAYFHQQKPYLNSAFKMTDLCTAMDVNRSVLSAFINRTYGMNFNNLVNQMRLRELERLLSLSANKGKKVTPQLVEKAGFTDLQQYRRSRSSIKN